MSDSLHQITIQIGAKMSADFKRTVEHATEVVQKFAKSMGTDVRSVTQQASTYTKQYTSQMNQLAKAMGAAKVAQKGLSAMGVSKGSATGIGAVAGAKMLLPKTQTPEIPQQGVFNRGLEAISSQVSRYQDSIHAASLKVEDAFAKDAISASKYASALSKLSSNLQTTHKMQMNLSGMRTSWGNMGKRISSMQNRTGDIMSSGLIAAGTLAPPIKAAIDFESQMADVRKVVDFDTPQQFKEMSNDIVALTREIPMSAKEIATLVASAGQAGIEKEGLLDFAKAAGKMGVAFDITAEQAGDMMAQWRTSFKMGQGEVNELADKINYLGNTTAASAPKISDVVTRIGPLGDIGGVASGEIAALGASMVGSGIQSEVAATGIKNLILGMTAGTGATKSQAAAFAMLGMDATDMAKKMQVDAKGAIMDVLKALKGLDKDQQASVLTDLFGKESVGAIAPLLSNLEGLQANFDKVANKQNYAGSVDKEYAERVKTTANQIDLLRNAFNEIAINVGSVMLPALSQFAEGIAIGAKAVADFAEENPGITQFLTLLFSAVTIAPVFSSVLGYVKDGILLVGNAIKFVANTFKFLFNAITIISRVMMANPILLAITAIAVAAYLIYTYWEPIKEFMAGLWAGVVQKWNGFVQWCQDIWSGVTDYWNSFTQWCGTMWESIKQMAVDTVNSVINWFTSMWDSPTGALLGFIGGPITGLIVAAAWVITHWDEVASFVATMWDAGITAIANFASYIYDSVAEVVNWAQKKWEGLKETLSNPITAIVNFVKGGNSEATAAGGKQISADTNAKGGIYGKGAFLTWFAEDSKEAAIPIDGSRRAESLWIKTGQMMGLLGTSNASGTMLDGIPTLQRASKIGSAASIMTQISNVTRLNMAQPQTPSTGATGLSSLINIFTETKRDREIKADIKSFYNGYDKPVEVNATFAPQITITGNADTSKLDQLLSDKLEEFKHMLDKVTRDRRRVELA